MSSIATALAGALAATLQAAPSEAKQQTPSLIVDLGLIGAYRICPDVLEGKIDLTDAGQLSRLGFMLDGSKNSQKLATRKVGADTVVISWNDRLRCAVMVAGPSKSLFRQAATEFAKHNGRPVKKALVALPGVFLQAYEVPNPKHGKDFRTSIVESSDRQDAMVEVTIVAKAP